MVSIDSNVKDRLVEYLDYKGINKNRFSKTIGVSPAYVNSIRKSIQPDKIKSIAVSFPDLNIEWLLTGEGEMVNKDNHAKVSDTVSMSREVFEQITRLTEQNSKLAETVLSQQNTIATLQQEKEKVAARQDEHAASADARESNVG